MKKQVVRYLKSLVLILIAFLLINNHIKIIDIEFSFSLLLAIAFGLLCVHSLIYFKYFYKTGIYGALTYYFLSDAFNFKGLPFVTIIIVALLIGFALDNIFKSKSKFRGNIISVVFNSEKNNDHSKLHINCPFTSLAKYINSDISSSVEAHFMFGELEIFFQENVAETKKKIQLSLDGIFGEASIYVPKHWTIVDNLNTAFAEVIYPNQSSQNNDTILEIEGSIKFAEVKIIRI